MHFKGKALWTDEEDLCNDCARVKLCPLVEALQQRAVLMATDGFLRTRCGFYEQRVTSHLSII